MDSNLNLSKDDTQVKYAGFWVRFAAYLIDSLIFGIPIGILFIIGFAAIAGSSINLDSAVQPDYELTTDETIAFIKGYVIMVIISFVLGCLYYAGLHASNWQATVGKRLLGLKVTTLNGDRISFWRALGRLLSMSLLSGIFMIGFIIAAFTEKKQALHDLIAGTVVIKNKNSL